ncbi:MAG: histidine kinase dimerization/phospho-acceptor domain-containing protein [Actinomycetota bacterium]
MASEAHRSLPLDRDLTDPGDRPLRRLGDNSAVRAYVITVSVLGLGLLGLLIAREGSLLGRGPYGTAGFWWISAFVVAAELFPISVQRGSEVDEITTSTTFAFALAMAYGPGPAALSLAVASVIGDVARRKPPWKVAFNVAQYTLSISAAAFAYEALSTGPPTTWRDLPAIIAGASAFFVVNTILPGIGVALSQGERLGHRIVRDFVFQSYTAPALLALSPIVLFAADRSLAFVPLLVIPILAVHWGATKALENVRLVERLQANLERMTELNHMKDDFVAVVSHELRTPLTSIQGYIKTLLQLADDVEPDQRETFLRAADRQSDRLGRLIVRATAWDG